MDSIMAVLDERNTPGDGEAAPRPQGKSASVLDVTLYLESTLALLVRSFGGHVEEEVMSTVAERFLCSLAYKYIDGIVLKATDYWDIDYERRDASEKAVRRSITAE